ncbi:MAG: hypothetical protein ACFFDT_31125 [Candidatus Hodarchaeota archaeon]
MKKTDKSHYWKKYEARIVEKGGTIQNRVLLGIPMTGELRAEWHLAIMSQVIPCNWSHTQRIQWLPQASPLRFCVADARNIIVKDVVEGGFEWLLQIDHDVQLPPLFFVHMNEYMIEGKIPVVTGLYFTKSRPAEPLVYRGRGNGYYSKWKIGDKVWVDGHGMGMTLIHGDLLRAMYAESEEYNAFGQKVRKVFETPQKVFYDPESKTFNTQTGTEDLAWCSRVMREGWMEKSGWKRYAKRKYPFLVDTRLFGWHLDMSGTRYPSAGEQGKFLSQGQGFDPSGLKK